MALKLVLILSFAVLSLAAVHPEKYGHPWHTLSLGKLTRQSKPLNPGEPTPKPCCAPDQFEAIMSVMSGYLPEGPVLEVADYSYDGTNQRMAYKVTKTPLPGQEVKTIIDFAKNRVYIITNTTCVYTESGPVQKWCIPADYSFGGQFYSGEGDDKLVSNSWRKMISGYQVFVTTTAKACIPLSEVIFGKVGDYSEMTLITFVDVTLGIKNPHFFDPPKGCVPMTSSKSLESSIFRLFPPAEP